MFAGTQINKPRNKTENPEINSVFQRTEHIIKEDSLVNWGEMFYEWIDILAIWAKKIQV